MRLYMYFNLKKKIQWRCFPSLQKMIDFIFVSQRKKVISSYSRRSCASNTHGLFLYGAKYTVIRRSSVSFIMLSEQWIHFLSSVFYFSYRQCTSQETKLFTPWPRSSIPSRGIHSGLTNTVFVHFSLCCFFIILNNQCMKLLCFRSKSPLPYRNNVLQQELRPTTADLTCYWIFNPYGVQWVWSSPVLYWSKLCCLYVIECWSVQNYHKFNIKI